jgi:methionyl-tRNA formyltransferase
MPKTAPVRAAIITQDDPFAVPALLEEFLSRRADRIVAVFIAADPLAPGLFATARRWAGVFDPLSFVRYGLRYLRAKLLGPRPARVAARFGIPTEAVPDVNAPEFLQRLRGLGIDLVISVACPQIFQRELLGLPLLGCINVHSGPLPRYRGMLPTFWVLYHHELETAVTVHRMNARLDDGPILLRGIVPIMPGETQAGLMQRCKLVGGRLLAETIDRLEAGDAPELPNPRAQATYFSFPTPDEARRFRAEGGRWL